MSRLQSAGLQCEMKHLFQYPVIATLAPFLSEMRSPVDQVAVSGRVPLTPIQRRFFREFDGPKHHFNQAVLLSSAAALDADRLRSVFTAILEHHDALRTVYRTENGSIVQDIRPTMALEFETLDLTGTGDAAAAIASHASRLHAAVDLERGPLMKVAHFRHASGDRLLIVIHHLVVDGISWRILFEDLIGGYTARGGAAPALPLKTASFKDWGEHLEAAARSESVRRELPFWSALDTAAPPRLPAKTANRGSHAESTTLRFSLSEEETTQLLSGIHHAFHTRMNDVLLTALARALTHWHGGDTTRIMLESHGREYASANLDVSRTVGWFTSIYPVVLEVRPDDAVETQLKRVKETLRKVPGNGAGYGVLRYLNGELPLAGGDVVTFNYLGQLDQDLSAGLFKFADESSGEPVAAHSTLPHDLSFVALAVNGRLTASVNFSPSQFDAKNIHALLDSFRDELSRVVRICAGRTARK